MKLGRLNHIGVATPSSPLFVTPAKAGVHHRQVKFKRQELDCPRTSSTPRLRGNDELGEEAACS